MAKKPTPPHGYDSLGRPIWALNEAGRPVCGHKTRRGTICQSTARFPNGRCKIGGGKAGAKCKPDAKPESIERRNRSEFYRNLGILDKIKALQEDPEITSHRNEIWLIEAMMINQVRDGYVPSIDLWKELKGLYDEAVKKGNAEALRQLGKVLEAGHGALKAETRILDYAGQLRKHREAEARREAQLQTNLNAREAQHIMSMLVHILEKVITNQDIPRERIPEAVGKELVRLVRAGSSGESGVSREEALN